MAREREMKNDTQWYEHVLQSVEIGVDGYTLRFDDGLCLGCPKVQGLPDPKAGETIRCYGRGFGYPVRGIVVAGRVYSYLTEAEQEAKHQQWVDDLHAKREKELQANLATIDARIAALPDPLRERILKFQRKGGHEFRRDLESYELFCCEQAVVIATALKTTDAIVAFRKLPWAEQKAAVTGLDDGHSGNTFGAACMLARLLIESPEHVTQMHGALAPLVGSAAYEGSQS